VTKKLLFLLDTDPAPSVFDTVVGYGGADHIIGYGGETPESVAALVDGTIYGSMIAGEALFKAVKTRFFGNFRVSVMLDSNGSNTTAAAGVALFAKAKSLAGKKAIVLAGTGPVGMRAAAMLHIEGAEVVITSRSKHSALRRRPSRSSTMKPARRRSRARRLCSPQTPSASAVRGWVGLAVAKSRRGGISAFFPKAQGKRRRHSGKRRNPDA
jgi:hypothetical protein